MPVVPVRSLRRIVSRINVSFLVSLLSLSPSHPLTFHFSPQPALCIRQFWRIWWRVSVRSLRQIVSGINVSFLVSLPSLSSSHPFILSSSHPLILSPPPALCIRQFWRICTFFLRLLVRHRMPVSFVHCAGLYPALMFRSLCLFLPSPLRGEPERGYHKNSAKVLLFLHLCNTSAQLLTQSHKNLHNFLRIITLFCSTHVESRPSLS